MRISFNEFFVCAFSGKRKQEKIMDKKIKNKRVSMVGAVKLRLLVLQRQNYTPKKEITITSSR
jgi:hypothetical protein